MEESWTNWLCDMELDDCSFINQSSINADIIGNLESNLERPSKLLKTTTSNSNSIQTEHLLQKATSSSTCSCILSFDNENPSPIKVQQALKPKPKVVNSKNESMSFNIKENTTHHTPDHLIAERIRREKISQQFIALAALIPNLKKMDKASVLIDAINYVKQLKEQVKMLEEQSKRKRVKSVMVVKKLSPLSVDEVLDTSSNSCNGNSSETLKTSLSLPKVEARLSGKNVQIRIICEKDKAVMVNVYREIEKLHFSVINASSFSFGSSVLAITIIAQMEDELNMSVQKLARTLIFGLVQLLK